MCAKRASLMADAGFCVGFISCIRRMGDSPPKPEVGARASRDKEPFTDKLIRKIKRDPIVPLGALPRFAAVAAASCSLYIQPTRVSLWIELYCLRMSSGLCFGHAAWLVLLL